MAGYILLDVGGTEIRGGIFDREGGLVGEMRKFPSRAQEDKEVILGNLCSIIMELWENCEEQEISSVGMAFPGSFDYEKGISRIDGVGKYQGIYGVALGQELRAMERRLSKVKLLFLHDVEAFAMGVCRMGAGAGLEKVICLCIGTGAGSAFVKHGVVQKKAEGIIPENGWIYCTPFQDSIIDNYLSARGLARLSCQVLGRKLDGLELSRLCAEKHKGALEVFSLFGEIADQCMKPFLEAYRPDALILGGQISKSFVYFGQRLKGTCGKLDIQIITEENTSLRAMQGLYAAIQDKEG